MKRRQQEEMIANARARRRQRATAGLPSRVTAIRQRGMAASSHGTAHVRPKPASSKANCLARDAGLADSSGRHGLCAPEIRASHCFDGRRRPATTKVIVMPEDDLAGANVPSPAHATVGSQGPPMRIAYLDAAEVGGARLRNSVDILIPTGSANLRATYRNGQGRDRTTFVRAPLVSILPPALPHSLVDRSGASTLILSICASFFHQVARTLGGEDAALVEPHATVDPLIREVGNAIEWDFRIRRPPDARYLESLAVVLAAHVARKYVAAKIAKAAPCGGLPPHKLRCVYNHICEHLGGPIRVEQLADAVHLSPFHFARMFKQSTGQSPHVYILMQRIERAKALLAETDTALVDVAAHVGFLTQGHFTGVFHRYAGFTPRAFRLHALERSASGAPVACGPDGRS